MFDPQAYGANTVDAAGLVACGCACGCSGGAGGGGGSGSGLGSGTDVPRE